MNSTPRLLLLAAAVIVGGATAVRASGDSARSAQPVATSTTLIKVPTVLDDWCGSMSLAFGPTTSVPTVREAFQRSMVARSATPEVAYVSLLEGIPDDIQPSYETLRNAGSELVVDRAIDVPGPVLSAADVVDGFVAENCHS